MVLKEDQEEQRRGVLGCQRGLVSSCRVSLSCEIDVVCVCCMCAHTRVCRGREGGRGREGRREGGGREGVRQHEERSRSASELDA